MAYIVHSYGVKPVIEEEHEHVSGIASDERTLSRIVEEIVQKYDKPCLITWYTMKGNLEFHFIKKN